MAKEICISTTPHETRLAILENDQLSEIYYERENEYTLAGSIYKGRVTRVLPGMQSAFVDIGLERDAFLYVTDFLEEQEDSADFERVAEPRQQKGRREQRAEGRIEGRPEGHFDARSEARVDAHAEQAAPRTVESSSEEDQQEEGAPSGTRRWRGRRGRRRGGLRGQQERHEPVTEQVEGGAPVAGPIDSLEAVAEAIIAEPIALPERGAPGGVPARHLPGAQTPIVLPGESLSKYGGKPVLADAPTKSAQEAKPARPVNYVAPKPSTLVEVAPTWDGGALLPGETLSRYRGAKPVVETQALVAPAPAAQAAAEEETQPPVSVAAATEGAPVTIHAPVPLVHEPADTLSSGMHVTRARNDAPAVPQEPAARPEPVASHGAPVHQPQAAGEPHAEGDMPDYEPESGSASFRIDPVPPSEFRLWGGGNSSHTEKPAAPDAPQAGNAVAETAPSTMNESGAESYKETPGQAFAVEAEEHTPTNAALMAAPPMMDESSAVLEDVHGFAPGVGELTEEEIDEEEYDFDQLHAHPDEHDIEELEEETLEHQGGTELGEMVRESHLNQRLSFGPDGVLAKPVLETGEVAADLEDSDNHAEHEEDGAVTGLLDIEEESGEEEEEGEAIAQPGRREPRSDRRGVRRGRGGNRRGGPGRRASAQLSDLPVISELLKQGQEILVQIAKEPIAKKGARITSHIALPGRFLVFMPTVNHVGVSRKISSDEERQRLKRILISEKGEASGGFIVRTAAATASEDDLRADIRFLIGLWNDIKQRSDAGKAPALIYHDLNLVERILRDQVSDNFSTIWVDSEVEYERIVRFLNRFQPELVRRVKLYTKETPLFEQFGIQEEITRALKSKVWLKSGGSIVINQTEALVAIDINTGKYVGKTARLEDTILKTNLDAIPEIVRQIRLRDLGGIIVIDFIDMDDRRNRQKVMQALEEELKNDRAPSKVLQFNDFGLVAITRKRVKQSLERTLSVPCEICSGTGMVKSPTTVANEIYIEMRKMQRHLERHDVLLRVNPEVVKTLKANNARWLNELEEMTGKTIIVKSDPTLHPEQFDIH